MTTKSTGLIAAAAFLASGALGVAGCSSGAPVPPPAASKVASRSPSTVSRNGGLASVNPCSLIPDSVASAAKLTDMKPKKVGSGRGCEWAYQPEDPTQIFTLRVNIEDHKGLGDLNFAGNQTQQYMVGKYHATQAYEPGTCAVVMGYSRSSSFDTAVGANDEQRACSLAKQFAQVVVENLPQD